MDINKIFEASIINAGNNSISVNPRFDTREEVDNILSTLPSKETSFATMAKEAYRVGELGDVGKTKDNKKYKKYGITPNNWENLDKVLADNQSNWVKAGNALAQSLVSEIGLGTLVGFSDIFDFVASKILHVAEDDFTNPVTDKLTEWQDIFRNEIAPIYADPDVNIQNGGLTNFGWYAKNIPNIASTLMLLFPAKALSALGSLAVKASKLGKGIGNIRRWATGVAKAEDASQLSKFSSAINSFEGVQKANYAVKTAAEGILMRTAENYQESRDTYKQVYDAAIDQFSKMTDEEYDNWLSTAENIFKDEKVDKNNRDEVAKMIARKGANRTFAMDWTNVVFDIMQLYALGNAPVGVKPLNQTRKIRGLQAESIKEAGKIGATATETAAADAAASMNFLQKTGAFGKRAIQGIYDFGKYNAKVGFAEANEAVEEAVNYIAQQEGITYGKMLLKGMNDAYENSNFLTATASSWLNMKGSLQDYLATPELQESAFWGLIGGVAFHHVGTATNLVQNAINRKAEAKNKKPDPITGEVHNPSLSELFEDSDVKTAKMVMSKRLIYWNTLQEQLKAIKNGKDPFSIPNKETKEYADFEGDIQARTAIARARAISDFRSQLAIDAINSGTFDLLTEYMNSDEVKQAMVQLGIAIEENINTFAEETLRDLEEAKDEYMRQSAHIMNQVAFINNKSKTKKGKSYDDNISNDNVEISPKYARIIANENYINARGIKAIQDELNNLGILEQDQINILNNIGIQIDATEVKQAVNVAALIQQYGELSRQEALVEKENPTNSIGRIQKFANLERLKSQKQSILKQLKNSPLLGREKDFDIANVYNAIVRGDFEKAKINGTVTEMTDDKIVENVRAFFGDEYKNVSNETIIQTAKSTATYLNSLLNKEDPNSIGQSSPKLFELFLHAAQLNLQKTSLQADISATTDQVRERINYYHNLQNEVRLSKIAFAEQIITDAIEQYNGVIDDATGEDLIPAIVAAYQGDITKAREIAESAMANPGEGYVTASEFIDALKILALHNNSNQFLFNWIVNRINRRAQNIKRSRTREIQENSTNSEEELATNSSEPINSSEQQQNESNQAPSPQNQHISPQQSATQNQQPTSQNPIPTPSNNNQEYAKLVINNQGRIVTVKNAGNDSNNGKNFPIIITNGKIEFDAKNMTPDQVNKLVQAGIFDVDSDVDFLAPGETWEVTQNPIIRNRKNKPFETIQRGKIENINNESSQEKNQEPAQEEEQIPQNQEPAQPSEPTQPNVEEEPISESEQSPEVPSTETSTPSTPVEESSTTETAPHLPTGVVEEEVSQIPLAQEGETSAIEDDIYIEVAKLIPDITVDNINFDEVREQVINKIKAAYPNLDEQTIKDKVNQNIDATEQTYQTLKSLNNDLLSSAANAAYNCKIADVDSDNFSTPFTKAIEKFLEEYNKILILKTIDGKKAISLDDLMRICNKAYPSSNSDAVAFYTIVKNYLLNHEDEYFVTDANVSPNVIFKNLGKTSQQIAKESNPSGEFRINIRDMIEASEDNTSLFNELDNLNIGDTIQMVVQNPRLVFISNGVTIGYVTKPYVIKDSFAQNNQGWITDVKVDANGNPISETLDLFKKLFLSDGKNYDNLREILARVSVLQENITDDDINEFIQNPVINSIIAEARRRKAKNEQHTILALDKNNNIDAKKVLLHLVRLWKYSNISTFSTDIEETKNNISNNLDLWFKKLFNDYNTIYNINTNQDVTITKKRGGKVVRLFENSTRENYAQLSLSNDAIADKENSRLTVVSFNDERNVVISGRPAITDVSQRFGSTYVTIFGPNPEPEYVKAYGVQLKDKEAMTKDGMLYKLGYSAQNLLEETIQEIIDAGRSSDIKKLEDVLRSILSADNDKSRIPLFRAIKGHFQIEPITSIDKQGRTSTGLKVVYVSRDANNNKTYQRFFFYNKDFYGNSFRTSNYIRSRTGNGVELSSVALSDKNAKTIAHTSARDFITFISDKVQFNIDLQGVISDNLNNHISKGFIKKINGKLVVDIPSKTPIHEEFDSYNDFIINNNLIRVNTKKSKNGTNFEKFGENEVGNAIISVSLPIDNISQENVIPSTNTRQLPVNVEVERFTSVEDYNELVNVFNGKPISGVELVKNILTEKEVKEFTQAIEDESLDISDLFDIELEYDYRINDYRINSNEEEIENRVKNQPIALTSGDNENATFDWYDEKGIKHTSKLKSKNRVIVGPRFINRASSRNPFARHSAIRTIMHEKIHNIIQSRNNKSIDLLKALEEVYYEFINAIDKELNFENFTDKQKEQLRFIRNKFEEYRGSSEALLARIQSGQVTNRTETTFRHTEEFLVETLTNSLLYNYLNSVYSEAISNENEQNKDNLLIKILKAIAKFFGWASAKDNTLLMKQFNVIRDLFDKPNNSNQSENIEENEDNEVIENINEEEIIEDDSEDEYLYDDDDLSLNSVIDDAYVNSDEIPVHNIDAFKNTLPLSLQADFAASVNRGEYEMTCK